MIDRECRRAACVFTPDELFETKERTKCCPEPWQAKNQAHLRLDVFAMRNVALARELAEPPPTVGARDETRVWRRRLRRR